MIIFPHLKTFKILKWGLQKQACGLQITTSDMVKLSHLGHIVASVLSHLNEVESERVVYRNDPFVRHTDALAPLSCPSLPIRHWFRGSGAGPQHLQEDSGAGRLKLTF